MMTAIKYTALFYYTSKNLASEPSNFYFRFTNYLPVLDNRGKFLMITLLCLISESYKTFSFYFLNEYKNF